MEPPFVFLWLYSAKYTIFDQFCFSGFLFQMRNKKPPKAGGSKNERLFMVMMSAVVMAFMRMTFAGLAFVGLGGGFQGHFAVH